MKPIHIFFGEMGSGKNYKGEKFAKFMGYDFFDGDDVVPGAMKDKVSKFQSLGRMMVDDYVCDILEPAIIDRACHAEKGLVVAQALYLDWCRTFMRNNLVCAGFDVSFWYVKVSFWQNLKQLWSRPRGFRWILYWLMNKPFFEKPTHRHVLASNS